ncbi:glycosyltransferase family 2 protein [Candidatus Falkowbacteria bacterium]|nr:glycosyltransferase family 2 protein [Candidatus Falkowbacteria bacterium]
MKLAVGFITYNSATAIYLPYFLDSLFKALAFCPAQDLRLLAIDNSDEADNHNQDYVEEFINNKGALIDFQWPGVNLGFSKSYNRMIQEASIWGADYFLMINPDTVIDPQAINLLVAALAANPELGAVVPKIKRWDFDKRQLTDYLDSCGLVLGLGLQFFDLGQGELDRGQYDQAQIIGPSGAAALFRMSALKTVKEATGYLDERFFMYKEDCDLAYRLNRAGYKSHFVKEALVYHDRTVVVPEGGLRGRLLSRRSRSRQVRSWSFVNDHLLFFKHWSSQSLRDKFFILLKVLKMFVWALAMEPFLLKDYKKINKLRQVPSKLN